MTELVGQHISPWVATAPRPDLGDTSFRQRDAEVLVIGAGIAGVTTALMLREAGRDVVLVEAAEVGHGVTAHSTVKATVGQGTVLTEISRSAGEDAARTYAEANSAGLRRLRQLAAEHDIDCDLESAPHVVYTRDEDQKAHLHAEAELAARLGLPATTVDTAPLPFDVAAAVSYADQVSLHPSKYLLGLTRAFVEAGGVLMEGVRATTLHDGEPCRVETSAGELRAKHVVVTTHFPVFDRGGHFARLEHKRSYGVALPLPDGVPAGMTISIDSPERSTRTVEIDGEKLLIVVGESHRVGESDQHTGSWTRLAEWAREHFGAGPVRYRWSTQDVSALDHLPYVGWLTPGTERVLTATGFAGWGMTNGTAAAVLLTDLVLGRSNPWADHFDARRLNLAGTGLQLAGLNMHVAQRWVQDRLTRRDSRDPAELSPGEAAVLKVGVNPAACYRDEDGELHVVSARCTHMHCLVAWNDAERTWDCPCHASRFDHTGEVLQGPAVKPLRPLSGD